MIPVNEKVLRRLLMFALAGTRGGPMRMKILSLIIKKPCNVNEISKKFSIDYKTAEYHIRVLEKSSFVRSSSEKYDNKYELSALLKSNMKVLKDVLKDVGKELNNSKEGD